MGLLVEDVMWRVHERMPPEFIGHANYEECRFVAYLTHAPASFELGEGTDARQLSRPHMTVT